MLKAGSWVRSLIPTPVTLVHICIRGARASRAMSTGFDPKFRQLSIQLDKLAPRIDLEKGSITVIQDPAEFYETLKAKIRNAESTIFLSTLYIGKTEHELISSIRTRMIERPKLTISILTDALRGTRESPAPCCASLLAPLVTEFGKQRVQISMFHTPNLSGWKKSLIPRRFDEGWGLQHMKLYGFDGEIILSGANLSNDYFTDRQDRYILFSSMKVTQFYRRLHDAVSSISYQVVPANENAGFTLEWKPSDCPEPIKNPKKFKSFTTTLLRELIKARPLDHCEFTSEKPPSTILYPLAQMTPLLDDSVSTEQPVVNAVLDALALEEHRDTDWYFTAGYFNVFEEYRVRLLRAFGHGTVITASPDANGFYKSSGPSGMLAAAYTLLSKRFLDDAAAAGKNSVIRLLEWQRGLYGNKDRWTYHAKGLWIKPNSVESIGPSLTFIGSSNFTRRSQNLDLEATAVLITADEQLQKQLASEVKNLQAYTTEVHSDNLKTPERRADLKTRFSLWLCQGML